MSDISDDAWMMDAGLTSAHYAGTGLTNDDVARLEADAKRTDAPPAAGQRPPDAPVNLQVLQANTAAQRALQDVLDPAALRNLAAWVTRQRGQLGVRRLIDVIINASEGI